MNRNLILSKVDEATTEVGNANKLYEAGLPCDEQLTKAYGILMELEIGLQEFLSSGS